MQRIRAIGCLTGFLGLTLLSIPIQWVAVKLNLPWRDAYPVWYHRTILRLLGIRLIVHGEPVRGSGALLIANHTSWLDMPVLSAVRPVSFVAKSEVSSWPLFGLLAELQRTIFVVRNARAKTGEQRDKMQSRLAEGDAIVLFPEGTSSDGNRVLPFNSSLLGAAQFKIADGARDVPVQPVSVAYTRLHGLPMGREYRPFFAWYGDMELVPHLWEAFMLGPIDVVIEFHPPLTISACGSRKALSARAEAIVSAGVAHALAGLEGPSGVVHAGAEDHDHVGIAVAHR
ncbi:MAG: 1-acyl-sn-glycerol-3-phosphate acyltransferase [Alphaproteobacteria bacterium]|nr:1-acyl-sn-glycerol-3-phosphate acyltransferase [Alphaproteobacteria bacterium]